MLKGTGTTCCVSIYTQLTVENESHLSCKILLLELFFALIIFSFLLAISLFLSVLFCKSLRYNRSLINIRYAHICVLFCIRMHL